MLYTTYWVAAFAFAALGHLEPAAVLAADARSDRVGPEWSMPRMASTDAAVSAGLGEDRLRELRDRGAKLDPTEAVAYLRAEADRVLGDESVD